MYSFLLQESNSSKNTRNMVSIDLMTMGLEALHTPLVPRSWTTVGLGGFLPKAQSGD